MSVQQQKQNVSNGPNVNPPAPSVEVFALNPYAADVNPSSYDGGKLYLNATAELPEKDKIKVSIENGPKVRDHFERCRSKCAWGLLLSKELDNDGNVKDVIKNYRAITKENILAFNNKYLGYSQNEAPPTNRRLPDLDPANDPTHKAHFYDRARSQMIAQAIQGRLDQTSIKNS